MRGISLFGTNATTGLETMRGSDEDDVFLLGLASPAAGCGVGALARQFLLKQFGGFGREARLIAQLKISSRLIQEVRIARGPQGDSWWGRWSVRAIATSADFSSTPTAGDAVAPRLWTFPTYV
jgi:hypothetical protein